MNHKPEEKPKCSVCGWPLATSAKEGCVAGNCSMRPRPEPRKMLAELLPGLRYAIRYLRFRGDSSYQVASLERSIAMMEAGKTPPFFEEEEG